MYVAIAIIDNKLDWISFDENIEVVKETLADWKADHEGGYQAAFVIEAIDFSVGV